MKTCFRQAKQEDYQAIAAILSNAILNMRAKGIDQWDELYPTAGTVQADIDKQQLYVFTMDDAPVASIVITGEQEKEYPAADWKDKNGKPVCIRRLCVDPRVQNMGIGKTTVGLAEAKLKNEGYTSIRFDAFSKNPALQSLCKKLEYCRIGQVNYRKGVYYLFEKLL